MASSIGNWPAAPVLRILPNGLAVALLSDEAAPLVSTSLWYRSGTAHEAADQLGIAHFLEHMMFKGSARYPAGEIDRLTQSVGGSNNAYTSHDGTVYVFNLPCRHWRLPLEIEADRMAGLTLAREEVAAEREVIMEEIAEVDDDPWDALSMAVIEAFFGTHPYARRILGSRESLAGIGAGELERFHASTYVPARAVLTVAGSVGPEVLDAAAELFASQPAGETASPLEAARLGSGLRRVEVARGETRRCLLAMSSAPAASPEFVHLRMALTVLAGGRSSPLQRRLVDEGRLCQSVSSEISESARAGTAILAAELLPGVEPERVETVLFEELERLRTEGVTSQAAERSRRLLLSDWLFSHETIELRGATVGAGLALFGAEFARRQVEAMRAATADDIAGAARRYLDPQNGGVIGWTGG